MYIYNSSLLFWIFKEQAVGSQLFRKPQALCHTTTSYKRLLASCVKSSSRSSCCNSYSTERHASAGKKQFGKLAHKRTSFRFFFSRASSLSDILLDCVESLLVGSFRFPPRQNIRSQKLNNLKRQLSGLRRLPEAIVFYPAQYFAPASLAISCRQAGSGACRSFHCPIYYAWIPWLSALDSVSMETVKQ